jgi:hypothetical protein
MIEKKPYNIEKKNYYLNLAIEAIQKVKESSNDQLNITALEYTRAQLLLSDIRDDELKLIENRPLIQYNI